MVGLQEDFPATIPTIFRTGDKLRIKEKTATHNDEEEQPTCVLCQGDFDTERTIASGGGGALGATQFSQLVSLKGPKGFTEQDLSASSIKKLSNALNNLPEDEKKCETETKPPNNGCGGGGQCSSGAGNCGCSNKKKQEMSRSALDMFLCYSCRVTVSKLKTLPEGLSREAEARQRRAAMKSEVQQFLL